MTMAEVTADAISAPTAGPPRLRLGPTSSRRTLLDGGWWPRSVDPAAELPGLILAIDKLHGPVTQLVLNAAGWEPHLRRLEVTGRIRRMGYFTSQPAALLTARCDNGQRVDLLVVPPNTARRSAEAAMVLAATAGNRIHAPDLLAAAGSASTRGTDGLVEQIWDSEGGRLA
jgi:hypothetical protein